MQIVVDLKDKASKGLAGINKKFSGMVAAVNPVTLAIAGVAAGFAAMGGVAVASVNAFRDFEEGMAGVAKTTGMSGEALAELGDGIKDMAKTIPIAHTELADIAAVAGQLGIQGTNNILAFTKTASEVAVAFDIPAEKAATVMAKLTNIYGLGIDQASNLASAINVLGNTTAASESQISDYAMSLGAAAEQMGFSATESMAMGATLISMGMDASDAGTRLNSAFTTMSKKTEEVAGFLGMTEEAFRDAFAKDQMGMIMNIVGKLSKIEDPLERAKVASELFGTVGAKAINGLGGNLEGLQTNLENSAKGFEENTSLSEEFAAKTDTLNSSFQLLKNALSGVAISIGEKLAPYVKILVEKFIELIPKLEAFASVIAADILPKVIEFAKKLKEDLQPGFDAVKEAVGHVITILSDLYEDFTNSETAMGTLESVVNVLVDTFNFLSEAMAAVYKFFADHPTITKAALVIAAAIALIISPVLAIIAAVALLAVAWDQNWFGIKDTVLRIVDIIVEKVIWFLDIIEEFWSKHGDTIMAVVTFMWDMIKGYIETAMDFINTGINVALDIIEGNWGSAWDRIVGFFERTKDRILEIMDTWLGDSITKITDWVTGSIQKFIDWKDESIQNFIDWVIESIQKFTDWKDESIKKITDWITESIQKFTTWRDDSIQKIVDFVTDSLNEFTNWRDEGIQKIVDFITDSLNKFTSWRDDSIQKIVDFVTDSLNEFTNWRDEGIQKIADFVTDSLNKFTKWRDEGIQRISDFVIDSLSDLEDWASDSLSTIESWASDIYNEISTAVGDAASDLKSAWNEMKSNTSSIFSSISSTVSSKMSYVSGAVDKAYKAVKDTISKIIKAINSIPGVPDIHNKSAPHDKSSGGHSQSHYDRASCSLYNESGYDRGAIKFQRGGPVDEDLNADLHRGEYVVPRKGALVMKDSNPGHVKITYNFGNVYGVNDLNQLLEKHDRDLYRKLVALV